MEFLFNPNSLIPQLSEIVFIRVSGLISTAPFEVSITIVLFWATRIGFISSRIITLTILTQVSPLGVLALIWISFIPRSTQVNSIGLEYVKVMPSASEKLLKKSDGTKIVLPTSSSFFITSSLKTGA